MKIIKLTKNYITLIDNEDFEKVINLKWYAHKSTKNKIYAAHKNSKMIYLHRYIMNITEKKVIIDHINGNTLDNRKQNLRVCSQNQNTKNRVKVLHKNKYKGVFKINKNLKKPYMAQIMVNQKSLYLGYFKTNKEAAAAYNKAAIQYFGEFVNLNNISIKGK